MIDNKAIFYYLNPEGCWHEGLGDGTLARCEKCGEFWTHTDREPGDWPNPDYTTEHGFFLLLEGLRAKGIEVELSIEPNQLDYVTLYSPRKQDGSEQWWRSAEDACPRIALAEAVMQLIPKDGEL
jgi:hypothetical protein